MIHLDMMLCNLHLLHTPFIRYFIRKVIFNMNQLPCSSSGTQFDGTGGEQEEQATSFLNSCCASGCSVSPARNEHGESED